MKNGKPSLRVHWTSLQNDTNVSQYEIEFRENGTLFWGHKVLVEDFATSVRLPGLDPGTAYNVRVRAKSDTGDGEWSEEVTGTTFTSEFYHLHVEL